MGVRVLLIEDDETIAEPLAEGLGHFGLTVDRVSTGADGLRGPYGDVVLLDLGLPDMDGIDVCRGIRQVSDVPVIILSARGEEADRVLGLELGADDYLAKPFSLRELVARVRAVTRRTQQGRGTQQGLMGPEFAELPGAGAETGALETGMRDAGPLADGLRGGGPLGTGRLGTGRLGVGRLGVGPIGVGSRGAGPPDGGRLDAGPFDAGTPGAGALGSGTDAVGERGEGAYDSGTSGFSRTSGFSGSSDVGLSDSRPWAVGPRGAEPFEGESFGGEPFAAGPEVASPPSPTPSSYESSGATRAPSAYDPAEVTRAPSSYEPPDVTRHFESSTTFETGPYETNRPHQPHQAEAFEVGPAFETGPAFEFAPPTEPAPPAEAAPSADPEPASAAEGAAGPGPLVVDRRTRQVWVGESPVSLTPKEFELLALLTEDPGAVYSRQQILDRVWDPHYQGPTKTLDVHVATLRRKLGHPAWIQTLRGVGFRLAVQNGPPTAGGSRGPGGSYGSGGSYGERPTGSYGERPTGSYGGERPSRPYENPPPSGAYAAPERPAAYP